MAKGPARDEELSTRAMIREKLLDAYKDIETGYGDQRERVNDSLDYWDAYNCKLGERQFYAGTSQLCVPFVYDAVEARTTRFVNQLFPQSGRYVEVTTENGDIPHATMALLEHYVRLTKLRTEVMPALIRSGDTEGQYSVYCGWKTVIKHLVSRQKKGIKNDGVEMPELGEVEDIEEETVERGLPDVEVLHDADVLILPATANSVEDAIEVGGWVVVQRRWSKTKIKAMIKDGDITDKAGEALLKAMAGAAKSESEGVKDTSKELAWAAGVKAKGKQALVYEAWGKLKVGGEMRICRAYFGGEDRILGCKLNPYWCDEVPVMSIPVRKMPGVAKGVALVSKVIDFQVLASDILNEGADSGHFAAMPITFTDPEKNPKVGTMIMGPGAVWETNPNDTQFAEFPDLWSGTAARLGALKDQIFQTLGVNPAMVPQSTGGKSKRNQAEIANEQQVDVLTTADAVINLEEGLLSPLLQRIAAYDHQFREDPIMIRSFGEMGLRAQMEEIEPLQMNYRYQFRWFGVEAARNAAQIQQQIAMANVIKGIPPQMYQGYTLKLAPLIMQMVEGAFGPRLAPLIFEDQSKQLSVDPEVENGMLEHGFDLMTHPPDNDIEHIQAHMAAMQQAGGDPHGTFRAHLMKHQQQMMAKNMATQQQQGAGGGQPGSPGGAGAGAAGTPAPGAQPGISHLKGPAGAVHQDQMARNGAVVMPRKT